MRKQTLNFVLTVNSNLPNEEFLLDLNMGPFRSLFHKLFIPFFLTLNTDLLLSQIRGGGGGEDTNQKRSNFILDPVKKIIPMVFFIFIFPISKVLPLTLNAMG